MSDRLDRFQFELSTAAVAATIATHFDHLPAWLWIPLAIMLPLRAWARRNGRKAATAWIRLPLTLLLFGLVFLNFGNVFGREPGSVLGCGLLALKMLEAERVRDARVAMGFSAFVLMSALLFNQSMLFTALVSAVLVFVLAGLLALQPAPIDTSQRLRTVLRLSALLLGCGLPLAAASFVLMPRLGGPLWGTAGGGMARTGLSDHMEPGALTELLIDESPALRVDFEATPPPPAERYFRAVVLSNFDGASWTRERGLYGGPPEEARASGAATEYSITLEATDQRWLPALDLPMSAPDNARLASDRTLVANEPVAQPRQYRVRSATRFVLAPTLTRNQRSRALALPEGFDSRTRDLARQWRAESPDDDAIVQKALAFFHASFTYTLSPPPLARDSIDDFLFATQSGFCEHYSSAFVVLMRAAGIPARVVTGYQGGWWNASGGYLLVRQSDAHAWAETWSEGRGWQRVDPTAAVSPARIERGAAEANGALGWSQADWLRGLRNQFDFANRLWTQGIVRFDALRQKGLLTEFGIANVNHGDLLLTLSAVLAGLMLIATAWVMWTRNTPRGDALDRAWERLGRRLARAGIVRDPYEGPLDLLRRTRASAPAAARSLEPLVGEYVALRYGTSIVDPQRVSAFARAVRRFRLQRRVNSRS
ncbi:MAG: DUF3488 and transglutaminase-like domain-containing protein [Dokdonella sp.]|uniref:transglutaminase TgpA family protein n=1 Tax=Dokdonella sp. TaxID=2291710 RepID=UPI0032657406